MSQLSAKVLETLREIKYRADENEECGICILIWGSLNPEYFRSWPEFSGSSSYPVPNKYTTPRYAFVNCKKWSKRSAYGKARWRLLDHLIECYEKELGL